MSEPDPFVGRARKLLKQKDIAGAVNALKEGLDVDSPNCSTAEMLGVLYFRLKQYDKASDVFRYWTRLDPRDPDAWVNLGAALNVAGDHKAASDALRKAIQRNKKSAIAYYNLGIAQKAMNQPKLAISAYEECLRIDPENSEASINLANAYFGQKQFAKAAKAATAGLEIAPKSSKLQRLLKKAEDEIAGSKTEESPFGRLVDEKELASRQQTLQKRELTLGQRNYEREFMRNAVRELRHAIRPIVTLLDEKLPKHMHMLHMSVFQQDDRYDSFAAYEGFAESMTELSAAFENVTSGVGEIRDKLESTDPGL